MSQFNSISPSSWLFRCILTFLGLAVLPVYSLAQGVPIKDFKQKLTPYFAEELVSDIERQLEINGDYKIWGWDVGDYSGDGYPDLAFAVKAASNRSRTVKVFLFVDIDGYLTRVGSYDKKFVELPIEVGILIQDTTCKLIEKLSSDSWDTQTLRFINGSLCEVDSSSVLTHNGVKRESYRNFLSLYGRDKIWLPQQQKTKKEPPPTHDVEFISLPCYRRGARVYQGYRSWAHLDNIRFVPKGAFWWSGGDDASMTVYTAHDDDYLYFSFHITDDSVVVERRTGSPSDKVEIWFDVAGSGGTSRYFLGDKANTLRTTADSGLFSFLFSPGNFADVKPSFTMSTTDNLTAEQKAYIEAVRVVAAPREGGFVLKTRIPLRLLSAEGLLDDLAAPKPISCTVVFRDIDNEYRPERETWLASSTFSDEKNPSFYGELLLIPAGAAYGKSGNIYTKKIVNDLLKSGF